MARRSRSAASRANKARSARERSTCSKSRSVFFLFCFVESQWFRFDDCLP